MLKVSSNSLKTQALSVIIYMFVFLVMKLWDLEEILEGSNGKSGSASGAAEDSDSDNDGMDLDDGPPKSSIGKEKPAKLLGSYNYNMI